MRGIGTKERDEVGWDKRRKKKYFNQRSALRARDEERLAERLNHRIVSKEDKAKQSLHKATGEKPGKGTSNGFVGRPIKKGLLGAALKRGRKKRR